MGNQVQAAALVGNALKALQEALPAIPMGSELHTTILDVVKKLITVAKSEQPDPHAQLQELIRNARESSAGGPQAALSRMAPPPSGGPPALPAPPPGGPSAMAA